MTQALVRQQSPEEREYARYLVEIEVRKRRIAEFQAGLTAYKEQLGRFNAEYHARVGKLFVELDRIELSISEYEFRMDQLHQNPEVDSEELERQTKQRFTDQREQIHEDEEETRYYEREHREEQERPELDEETEASLRMLFRDLAKRFHPDLAKTDGERQQRETIMKQVNAAFHERDIDELRSIGAQNDVADSAFEAKPIGEKLVWAIREVSRLDDLIDAIQSELAKLETGDLATLWRRQQLGEDVLDQLERDLRSKIDGKREQLQWLIAKLRTRTDEVYRG